MKKSDLQIDILKPQNQLQIFGFDKYFNLFINLFNSKKMPNSVLLSGPKGSGKSTFVYHLINYLLSKNEEEPYNVNNFIINEKNKSFKLIENLLHPNFFVINNKESEKEIKIDQIRQLSSFLNKSTYSQNIKFVLIDNAENLNLNSSNALLKAIEEPNTNTFFFVIHDSSNKILDTIKSRCVQFNIFFNEKEKITIFNHLLNKYHPELSNNKFSKNLYFETPGNLLKYISTLKNENDDLSEDNFFNFIHLVDIFKKNKSPELLLYISLSIQIFYSELIKSNKNNINTIYYNYVKILKQLNNMKKFNLDDKAVLLWIKDILVSETK